MSDLLEGFHPDEATGSFDQSISAAPGMDEKATAID